MRDTRLIPGDILIATKSFRYFEKSYQIGDKFDYPVTDFEAKKLIRARRIRVGNESDLKPDIKVEVKKEIEKEVKEKKAFELSQGAKDLINEYDLTDNDLESIEGTGAGGKILKSDVEIFLSGS